MVYIKEIQGLRAVAALLVAIYHIWFNRVSGGVDAFFVIAAFFMMSSFLKADNPNFNDILRYYSSTIRRVVPLAVTVILFTITGTILIIPDIYWRDFAFHAFASSLFIENWWLSWTGTDYLRLDSAVSPFQQMWALSLQMQFYFILPLTILAVAKISVWKRISLRAACTAMFLAIFIISFSYNLWITENNQPWAYFDSFARAWEYMLGALLALNFHRLPRITPSISRALGYLCLFVLVGFAAVIPVGNSFPGIAALIPVFSTLGLIVAAQAGANIAPLTNRPILALGEISFSFYLWHWPLLIFWRQWTGDVEVGIAAGIVIIGLSGGLAWVTLRIIESPFRRLPVLIARPTFSIFVGAIIMLPAIGTTYLWADANRTAMRDAEMALASFAKNPQGWSDNSKIIPDPLLARNDNSKAYADGCHQSIQNGNLIECIYGKKDADRTIVLIGGSHSLQWLPALEDLALSLDFRIISMTKSSCLFLNSEDPEEIHAFITSFGLTDPESCLSWNAEAEARIMAMLPDLVITIGTRGRGTKETVPNVFRSQWEKITSAGIQILILRDNPWFSKDVVECVSRYINNPSFCNELKSDLLNIQNPGLDIDGPMLKFVDFTDLYCDELQCWAVNNGILLYRDRHHLTASFVRAHSIRLRHEIVNIIGDSPLTKMSIQR